MNLKNLTPFPFATKVTSRRPPRPEMTSILRACYELTPGQPLALAAQGSLSADTYREGDDERAGECLGPDDFADWKPRAEVMLRGTCHTPFGKPLAECPVRFGVGGWSKTLRVIGRRFWSDDQRGAVMSRPAPFTKMPVDWAHAFGGPGCAANPVGLGHDGRELPNVEHAGVVLRARRDRPEPAGFGPLNPGWSQRRAKVGKEYGRSWRKERWPHYSADFDWTYFNAAPADQQLDGYLRGDEALVFQNLHPTEQVFETRLPALRIRAFVKDRTGRFREVAMRLDTLFADLDQGKLYLTWRGLDAIETEDKADVQTVLVASEPLGEAPLPEGHYRDRIEAFAADPLGIKEHVPADLLQAFEDLKRRTEGAAPAPDTRSPAPDPLTAALRRQLDALPAPFPGAPDLEEKVAGAVARMIADAPPEARAAEAIARAANDAEQALTAPTPAAAIALRPGGSPPAGAAESLREAIAKGDRARQIAVERGLPQEHIDEIGRQLDALRKEPFFQAILSQPPPREPGPSGDLSGQDYQGRDLRGRDLRGANLRDANLAGADLAGADLAGARLDGAVLAGADLTGADLTGADLTLANLTGARASGAILRGTKLDRAFLEQADLSGAVLAGARGELTFLPEADLRGADAKELSLHHAFAKGARLEGADLTGASLTGCLLLEVKAGRASFRRATLTRSSFARGDLRGATFVDARAERSVWLDAALDDADFTRAVLTSAFFTRASCPRACFRRSILREARCDQASFERADFTESQLFGIDLSRCALGHARFTGANLWGAKLRGAAGAGCDFSGANLKRSTLEDA